MPRTILHLDASARKTGSVTRALSAEIVSRLNPGNVIRRDLAEPLPLLDEAWIVANFTRAQDRNPEQRAKLALSDTLIAEIAAADTLVIGAPIYNFSVPAALKAWIDLIARAGVTFRYTETGPEGLLRGKRAIIAAASGGTEAGSEIDFATGYLRHVLGFIGIADVELVAADRLMVEPDGSRRAANAAIDSLIARAA